ncbi:uncharacterized protein rab44 isoform X2 [Leuresthes tenuis]|uniref:uncharacterized protein rab44 isoform X2 n=1 Tax=Leuresthes tenuis TaxID=355514 RepID=UPI003B50F342
MNRRKLGSSRRNKGKRHAKDTENEPEAREDVEDNRGDKTLEVQTSAAAQLEMQEELTRGTEHSISASHDSLVVSPAATDYSEIENPMISPESVMEALMPNTGDLQACKSEPNLEMTENYDCLDSVEIKENAHVGQSTSDCVSPCPVVDQQLISIQAANSSMSSEPDLESNKRDDTDLFRQDGSLEGVDLRTKNEAWINSTEKAETAFGQMYECESHVEDDVKHSAGQTLHQEGAFEVEKFNLSLQTLPSEVNVPLDSQLRDSSLSVDEQTETGVGHFGNRRKLGSSRRNKGRQRVEECKEDVLEKAKGVETLEKNDISMEMRATSQNELYQDTEHDISSSVSHDSSVFSVSVPVESSDQTMCPETDLENCIPKSENLPEDQDERETDINVKVSDELEEAEQQDVDDYDTPHSEDSSAHHSDDTVKEMQEDMVLPTQAHGIDSISETMIDNAAENSEIISGNLISQAEIINISQSELTEESADGSATKQEVSSPHKQNDFCSIESDLEAVDPRDEDDRVYGSRQIWTSDTENAKTAVGQMHEDESEVEDNVKLSPGQSVHSDKDSVLFEAESSIYSLENLPSEINAPSDTQHQDSLMTVDEQTDTVRVEESKPEILERARVDKVPETTKIQSETKTTNQDELSQDTEHGIGLSVSHDDSMFSASAPTHSSEVEGSTPKTYPETEKENLILKSENLPEDQDERETDINVEVLDKSAETMPQEVDKSDTSHSELTKDADRSDDAVREEQKEDIHPTQMQEILHIDYSSETVTDNAPENSANLIDCTDIMNTYQSEFNNDNSATKQEMSNPEEKPDEHPTKQDISEPLDLENDDYNLQCTNKPHISDLEKVDCAPSQVNEFKDKVEDDIKPITNALFHQEKEGLLSETEEIKPALSAFQTETTVSFDCQLEDNSDSVDAQNNTGFHQRRKLGSSRRNKGKHKVNDSVTKTFHQTANEVDGNASSNTYSEVALTTETAGQEKSMEIILEVEKMNTSQTEEENVRYGTLVCASELTTIGVQSTSTVDQRVIENSCCRQMPHEELPSVSSQTDTESEERHERTELLRQDRNSVFEPHVSPITPELHTDPGQSVEKLSPEEEFPTKKEQLTDVSASQQSEDAVKIKHGQETRGMSQIDYTTEKNTVDSEISGNAVEQIEIGDVNRSEAAVRNTDYPKPQIDDVERVETALGDAFEIEGQVKDAMNPRDEGTDHHTSKGLFSEICDSEYSLQSPHCEMNAPLDSQLQQSYTSFNPGGNSGAPGSSQEKSMEIKLEEMDKSDTPHTEKITLYSKEKAYFGTTAGISELTTSNPTVEQQLLKSNFRELPDDELPTDSSTTENKEKHEDTEMLRAFGNSHGNNLSSENVGLSIIPERTPEKSSPQDHNEVECSVTQDTISSEENVPSNEEQDETLNLSEAAEALYLEDVVSKEHEEQFNPAQIREMCQLNCATITEKNSSLQTQESDTDPPLDSQPLDNYQSFKDDTQSGLKPAGNRRKMGSSRRNKGRQQGKVILPKQELKEAVVENAVDDKVTEMSAANTMRQEELEEHISVEKVKISSTVTGDENQDKLLEDTLYSHNVLENIVVATSDTNPSSDNEDSPKSNKDLNEKHSKHVKEPGHLSHLTGYDTVKRDLTQSPQASVLEDDSDMQSILYHDDINNPKSGTVHVSHQEEAQATGALPCDSDSQQADNVTETVDCVTVEDCSTEVESSMEVQGPGQDEGGEKGVHTAQKMENTSQEAAVDVSCESGISTTKDEHNSLQEESQSDYSENLQVKSKQRRRKMGSSRRTLNKKEEGAKDNTDETEESFLNTEAGVRNLEEMEVVEELPLTAEVSPSENVQGTVEQQENDANKTSHYDYKLKSSTSHKQSNESNVILALPPDQSTSVNQVTFNKVADERTNIDLSAEMSQQDDFTSTNMQITSDVAGRNDGSFSQLMPPNSETNTSITGGSSVSFCEVIQSTQNDEARPESVKLVKVQDTDEQKPSNWTEGTRVEEKCPSPNLNSPNRRRKLGSTRKNLSSRTKREDFHQNQELENEATEAVTATEDGTTESDPQMKEKDLQPGIEHKDGDSEKRKEKIIETMKISHVSESLLTPQAEQTAEESPISQSQSTESENQQTPSYLPSTSAKNDSVSQSASGGRRKKFGSSRKPNTHQSSSQARSQAKIGAQNENVVRGFTEDGANKGQSSGLRKISEVGEGDEKATADISKAEELSGPVSEKTSTQPELSLAPGSATQLSFGGPRGTDYDVVMVGDSCVGKTSFMKRAQSGKFSLDIPASVGLDSCIWTVVVEGKPVVLQLWDTAGQERFRSITRQIFHKARAFLLMYDITSTQSFSAISYWANSIQEAAAENVTVLLLGNKSDHEQRQVKTQQGEILAKEYNFEFMECSAATGENVIEALETVARMLSQRADLREEATVLLKEPAQKKRSTCC